MTSSLDRVQPKTIVVIGGGFSGLLTAIHLLEGDPSVLVRLVEKSDRFGRGRAYSAANPDHLLNVRASNMSAFPDQPDHLVAWLRAHRFESDGFVSRGRYGAYLQALLREALSRSDRPVRLLLEQDEAVAVEIESGQPVVRLALGRSLPADAVVLALGLGLPDEAAGAGCAQANAPAYFADPWRLDSETFPAGEILLIGAGLTMVDAVLTLWRPDRRFYAVSRHGLLPHSHGPTTVAPLPAGPLNTPRQVLRQLRDHATTVGWRSAVDSLRPLTPAIWSGWSHDERRRFLRHARVWWDIHRHRMAPEVAENVDRMLDDGRLTVRAARLEGLEPAASGLIARLRPRGANRPLVRTFAAAVNCAGLSVNLRDSSLLQSLMRKGALRQDPLRLGIDVDARFRVVGADGAPTPSIYAVGPLTRAARWESIAVPDLRAQAAEVAATVLEGFVGSMAAGGSAASFNTMSRGVLAGARS